MPRPTKTQTASHLIRRIVIAQQARGDEFVRDSGLSIQAGRTIGYIHAHQDRGVIQREIAEMSGRTAASVASLLKGLETGGYIERRVDPDDVRSKRLYVLPKGVALIDGFDQMSADAEADLLAPLSPTERTTFVRLLSKVADGIS